MFLVGCRITVTENKIDSKEQLYKNRIAEKDDGSDGISIGKDQWNVYDCYYYVF